MPLRSQIISAVDVIVQIVRERGRRFVSEIAEVRQPDRDGHYELETLYALERGAEGTERRLTARGARISLRIWPKPRRASARRRSSRIWRKVANRLDLERTERRRTRRGGSPRETPRRRNPIWSAGRTRGRNSR